MKTFITLAILCVVALDAATITQTNTCTLTTTIDATLETSTVTDVKAGGSPCQLTINTIYSPAYAYAKTSHIGDTIFLGNNGFYELPQFSINQSVSGTWDGAIHRRATAQSEMSFQEWIITDGQPRTGYIQVLADYVRDGYNGPPSVNLTVGGIPQSLIFPVSICATNPNCTLALVPFQLGEAALVDFAISRALWATGDRSESLSVSGSGAFRLLEADGVTPVAAFATQVPEPATWAAVSLGLGLIGWRSRSRQ